jgi:hypothetical protein
MNPVPNFSRKCYECKKDLSETNEFAILWKLPYIGFLCIPCSEKEGYKEFDPRVDPNEQP